MSDGIQSKIEIYKMYVETSQKISDCRININKYFITLNLGIVGISSFAEIWIVLIFAMMMNCVWASQILTCKNLNKAKFDVIHRIEEDMPYQPFKDEYVIIKQSKCRNFTSADKYLPWLLNAFYFITLLFLYGEKLRNYIKCLICC